MSSEQKQCQLTVCGKCFKCKQLVIMQDPVLAQHGRAFMVLGHCPIHSSGVSKIVSKHLYDTLAANGCHQHYPQQQKTTVPRPDRLQGVRTLASIQPGPQWQEESEAGGETVVDSPTSSNANSSGDSDSNGEEDAGRQK